MEYGPGDYQPEPAPPDYRNQPRGGEKTDRISFRVTPQQRAELKKRYGAKGRFVDNVLSRLLD